MTPAKHSNRFKCPTCGSHNSDQTLPLDYAPRSWCVWSQRQCRECGTAWENIFTLTEQDVIYTRPEEEPQQ